MKERLTITCTTGIVALLLSFMIPPVAYAQGPTPTPPLPPQQSFMDKASAIVQLALDTLQGRTTAGAGALFDLSRQSASSLVSGSGADLFFLDFGDPNLPLNRFALEVARNLLALTPLYALGYLAILIYNIWREKPVPNPLLYTLLVIGVMIFLAAFAVITQGISQVGRALAVALGGTGTAFYARATLLDTVLRILVILQRNGGILSAVALLVAIVETAIILIQLAYRGISMAIWRLIGVLLVPLSVLLEGVNPRTAGKVVSGFFEAWLDMVGKVTLLLITLSVTSADAFANYAWFILPAGLLVVVTSWKFFGLFYSMLRDAVARGWADLVPASATEPGAPLPAAAEAAQSKEIDAERRRLLEE